MPMIFFHFLKIIFDISTSKRSKKYKPYSILTKKKLKFSEKQVEPQSQTDSNPCLSLEAHFSPLLPSKFLTMDDGCLLVLKNQFEF
jgi:hypothetical protein